MKSTEDNRADHSCTHLGTDINILSYLLAINAREERVYDVLSILSPRLHVLFPQSNQDQQFSPCALSSVQFSLSVVSDSLQPHESQHARPPWPSPTPGVHSDSCPSSQWCHPAISSSVIPFSSYPQSLPASESFPMSQHFAWGGQSTGVSETCKCRP